MVCVVGAQVDEKILPEGMDILGTYIMINNQRFRVIGELKSRSALEGGEDSNSMVFVPLATGQDRLTGRDDLYWMVAKLRDSHELERAKEDISARLRASRRIRSGADDDFSLSTADDWAEFSNNFVNTLIMVFGVVAVIALLVGGIGVMNIMLVAVSERRREIGIRMTLGATAKMIRNQFLFESTMLCMIGGFVGVLFGILVALALSIFMEFHVVIELLPGLVGLLITSLVGIFFGYYPAHQAAKLDPINCLAQ